MNIMPNMLPTIVFVGVIFCGGAQGGKIIGGQTADPGQFPGIVSIQFAQDRTHFCGGAIISEKYILTAAHCFSPIDDPQKWVIYAGTNDITTGGVTYNISSLIIHADFNPQDPLLQNDIALVQTSEPIQFSQVIQPITLPEQDLEDGAGVTAAGWGTIMYPVPNFPNDLHFVLMHLTANDDCGARLGANITDGQLCTDGRRGVNACFGDSGGPLLVGNTTYGIVSWGQDCGFGNPDVFTRVSAYKDWIAENTN